MVPKYTFMYPRIPVTPLARWNCTAEGESRAWPLAEVWCWGRRQLWGLEHQVTRGLSWKLRHTQRHDFYISVFHNKHGHLQNNTQPGHTANNLLASDVTEGLDVSSEERWNNNHPFQEMEYVTGWIHYSPKGESFIFFHSFSPSFFLSKLNANCVEKALRSNNRNFTPNQSQNQTKPNQMKTKKAIFMCIVP